MWLLNYEDFKNFTLSPAYSLICMTSLTKTIVHIYGPWAISVPHMMCILCIVIEISRPQAFLDKITLSSAHYAY